VFKASGLGLRAGGSRWGSRLRVYGLGFRVEHLGTVFLLEASQFRRHFRRPLALRLRTKAGTLCRANRGSLDFLSLV
jgi:hypothetical protein